MAKFPAPSIDLDNLLAIAEQRGCACNRLFDGPCLVHYVEQHRHDRGFVESNPKRQEEFYVRPDRSTRPENSPRGRGRSDAAVRAGSRSEDRGNGKRSEKAAHKPPRKR